MPLAAPAVTALPDVAPPVALRDVDGRQPRILVVSGSVGAGHDGVASELARRLRAMGLTVHRKDYLAAMPPRCRTILRAGYPITVGHISPFFEWLFQSIEDNATVRAIVLAFSRLACRQMRSWLAEGYDVVVSTYPLASQALGYLRERGELTTPVVTILTDPAAHRTWVHTGVDWHLTITEATAEHGSMTYGVPMYASGPLVPERFGRHCDTGRAALRRELGLPLDTPLALLVTGSLGLGNVVSSARDVRDTGVATPVVLCGHNGRLRRSLAGEPGIVALGWRDDVPNLMAAADVLVHNAGGLSFTEALTAGLPAVSYACLPGHGRANAEVLDRAGLAPWAHTPAALADALRTQLRRPRPEPWQQAHGTDAATHIADLAWARVSVQQRR